MRTSLVSLIIVLFTPELSFCENPPFSPNHTVQTHLSSFPLPPARCRAHTAFTAYLLLVKAQTSSGELSSVCLIYVTTTAPQQVFPLTDLPTLPTSKTACRASLCPPEANIFVSFLLPVTELFTATFWELIPPFCPQNKCCDQVQQHEFPTKMKAPAFCVMRYNLPKQIFKKCSVKWFSGNPGLWSLQSDKMVSFHSLKKKVSIRCRGKKFEISPNLNKVLYMLSKNLTFDI